MLSEFPAVIEYTISPNARASPSLATIVSTNALTGLLSSMVLLYAFSVNSGVLSFTLIMLMPNVAVDEILEEYIPRSVNLSLRLKTEKDSKSKAAAFFRDIRPVAYQISKKSYCKKTKYANRK